MNHDELDKLLLRLEPDFADIEKRYSQLRLKLMKFFSWRRCEDSEGLADETITRTIKKIVSGVEIRTTKPYSYIYAVATNVFREYLREQKRRQVLVNDRAASLPLVSDDLRDCRRRCLENLAPDKMRLLEQYYSGEESRERLARAQGVSLNAMRLQVHRIKNDLRACHQECIEHGRSKE